MKKQILSSLFTITLFLPMSSWALFEARASYGLLTSKTSISDVCQGNCLLPSNAPGIVPTYGTGIDAILKLPLVPLGFGLRYENMGLSTSSSTIDAKLTYSRTAILINYRLIDTIVHFGPILSYGISHTGSFTIKESGVTKVDLSPSSITSYSIGLELEVKPLIVVPIIVGAEAGYMGYNWKDATNNVNNTTKSVDLSGTYIKVFLGLDI